MGATYTRQSTYTEGDIIQASDTNDEFDQLLAAFAASTGHTHDGTTGEGGPITTLAGHSITIGLGTAGTDITLTFDGETSDGVLKWMEDEDYFEFSDDILVASTEKIQFGDTATFIQQSSDGVLRIDGEATVDINASTAVLISNDLKLDSDSAILGFGADNDTTLTHTDGTGLTLNSTNKLTFGDAASFVQQSSDGVLRIDGEATIDLNASTAVTVSNDLKLDSDAAVLGFGVDNDVTLTHVADTGLLLNSTSVIQFNDASQNIGAPNATTLDINATDEIELNATLIDVNGNLDVSGTLTVAGALDFGDANITNVGSIALDTITNDGTDITLDSSGDIILDADGADVFLKDAGTTYGSLTNSSGNLVIKSGTTTALTFSGANATLAGDLTISGDDLTMGTNTAGHLLIADGTNFNPTAVGDLSEISTVANDDVFLAVDTSGGGLKKITRSTIVAGLAVSGSGISNIVEDTTPQLGGSLDVNGEDIVSVSNGNITLTPNGSGVVRIDGSNGVDISSGAISIKNSGAQSYVRFYCESSNAHYVQLQAPAHANFSGNHTVVLPNLASTLATTALSETLTNKTLTSPVLNTATVGTSIVPSSADGATLGSASAEFSDLFLADGATIKLGNDQDVTITHVADTGILLSGTNVIQFNDASQNIGAPSGTVLDINATDEIELNATLVDVNANLDVSGTYTGGGLMTTGGNIVIPDAGNIGSASDTDAIAIASNGVVTFSQAVSGTSADFDGGVTIDDITIDGTEIDLSSGDLTVDVAGDIILDADGGDFKFQDGGTEILRITNSSSDVVIRPVVDAKDLIFQQRDGTEVARIEDNGTFNVVTDKLAINGTAVTSTAAELNILDGATATASEINLLDGDTSVGSSITLADADGFIVNDNGTMKTIPASDVKTYAAGSSASKGFAIAMAIVFG